MHTCISETYEHSMCHIPISALNGCSAINYATPKRQKHVPLNVPAELRTASDPRSSTLSTTMLAWFRSGCTSTLTKRIGLTFVPTMFSVPQSILLWVVRLDENGYRIGAGFTPCTSGEQSRVAGVKRGLASTSNRGRGGGGRLSSTVCQGSTFRKASSDNRAGDYIEGPHGKSCVFMGQVDKKHARFFTHTGHPQIRKGLN